MLGCLVGASAEVGEARGTAHDLAFIGNDAGLAGGDHAGVALLLAEHLTLPLRERNDLLLSGGYAPVYGETALHAPAMPAVRSAVRQVLSGHQPYPAVVVDRAWNLVDANPSLTLFIEGLPGSLLTAPVNVLRASLYPDGMAARIANLLLPG